MANMTCPRCGENLEMETSIREEQLLRDKEELLEALKLFLEPMRRYTTHKTWLKGDENMLIAAYENAKRAIAKAEGA